MKKSFVTILLLTGILSVGFYTEVNAETYTYDKLNRIESVTYDSGDRIEYKYDANGVAPLSA